MSKINGAKTNKLVIYLIKPEYQNIEEILDSDREPYEIDSVGSFVFEESHPHPPDWLADFFEDVLGAVDVLC